MPIWPFKRRRGDTLQHNAPSQQLSEKKPATAPTTRSTTATNTTRATTPATYSSTHSPFNNEAVTSATRPLAPRTPNTAAHQRAGSQTATVPIDIPRSRQGRRGQLANPEKENLRPIQDSREDVTALPVRRRLEQSPHLRTVSPDKPPIPYNFFGYSRSQTDVPRPVRQPSRTGTLSRRTSQKSRKSRRDDPLREEEIRAMSAASPIPPVSRDELLRKESKRLRGKSSIVTLPAEGSIRSSMSGRIEQRGWEVGALAVLNPRPSVRLSGIERVLPGSLPNSPSGVLYRIDSIGIEEREPTPPSRGSRKKRRQLIGDKVDDLDASDLRVILERDAKRKERRRIEQQERLERKVQARADRARADSDAVPIDSDGELRAELIKARVEEERRARAMTPPTDVHPALRDPLSTSYFRENNSRTVSPVPVSPISEVLHSASASVVSVLNEGTYLRYPPRGDIPQNPFVDQTDDERFETPMEDPAESLFDDPVVSTAQEVRMSVASKPPPSPVHRRFEAAAGSDVQRHSLAETTSSVPDSAYRRSSVPATSASFREKRSAPWSSFFRRGNTIRQSAVRDVPSTSSFSNTSRESMRAAGIPAHLVEAPPSRPANVRSHSGTPARTMSKFREDLPEMPTLLPEAQDPASDVAIAAAAAHAARRHRTTPSVDTTIDANTAPGDAGPTSPHISALRRGHERIMSSSMASIDSEGSWLAGGSKRQSMQSGFSRSMSQRRADFGASYEELGSGAGGDRDAEYISGGYARHTPLASPDIPDDIDEAADPSSTLLEDEDAVPVAGTVRRRPTVVAASSAAARVQSREGLVSEFLSGDRTGEPEESPRISHASASEADSGSGSASGSQREGGAAFPVEMHQLQHAKSINYHERHSRQFSAGSARLLDVKKAGDASAVLEEKEGAA